MIFSQINVRSARINWTHVVYLSKKKNMFVTMLIHAYVIFCEVCKLYLCKYFTIWNGPWKRSITEKGFEKIILRIIILICRILTTYLYWKVPTVLISSDGVESVIQNWKERVFYYSAFFFITYLIWKYEVLVFLLYVLWSESHPPFQMLGLLPWECTHTRYDFFTRFIYLFIFIQLTTKTTEFVALFFFSLNFSNRALVCSFFFLFYSFLISLPICCILLVYEI